MWIASAALAALLCGPVHAEEPASAEQAELPAGVARFEVERDARGQPGLMSLDVVNADIHGLLRLFSEVGGLNFVVDDSVKGTVTARLVDVRWEEALAAILLTKGLAATPVPPGPSVLRVHPIVPR